MTPEKEQELVKAFPQIFVDYGGDPMKTCLAFGIECLDGWYDLIYKLCKDIMATNPPEDFKAEQVKSKYASLRFYVSGSTEEIYELIDKAEAESYNTCEYCGSREDVQLTGSWVTSLCKGCRDAHD